MSQVYVSKTTGQIVSYTGNKLIAQLVANHKRSGLDQGKIKDLISCSNEE